MLTSISVSWNGFVVLTITLHFVFSFISNESLLSVLFLLSESLKGVIWKSARGQFFPYVNIFFSKALVNKGPSVLAHCSCIPLRGNTFQLLVKEKLEQWQPLYFACFHNFCKPTCVILQRPQSFYCKYVAIHEPMFSFNHETISVSGSFCYGFKNVKSCEAFSVYCNLLI